MPAEGSDFSWAILNTQNLGRYKLIVVEINGLSWATPTAPTINFPPIGGQPSEVK